MELVDQLKISITEFIFLQHCESECVNKEMNSCTEF
jgi:hypothetical protein